MRNQSIEKAMAALQHIIDLLDQGAPVHAVRVTASRALDELKTDQSPSGTTASSPIVDVNARSQ